MPQPSLGNSREPDQVHVPVGSSTSHRRYSSTDSMEGSINSSHSRQGSDSNDANYATRRMSAQMQRRQSQGDPLQFIKGKPSTELAQLAETQIKVAAESKKEVITTKSLIEEEEPTDWQANLSTWKNRRKSQSEKSYQMKEELEKMEREKEGVESSAPPVTKTYSQMQEDRERRKSVGRHFYPIHDDDVEDDIFSMNSNDKKKAAEEVFTMTNKPLAEIAPWARDDPEIEKNDKEEEEEEEEDETSESEEKEANDNNEENERNSFKDKDYSTTSTYSSRNSREGDKRQNDISRVDSTNRTYMSQQRASKSENSPQDMIKRTESFKGVGPRTQSKIGSIMQNFQDSQNSTAAPKHGYNEKIDLKSRMKSFQGTNGESNSISSGQKNESNSIVNSNRGNFHNYRTSFDRKEDESSSSATVSHIIRERSKSSSSDTKRNSLVERTIKIRQKPNDDKGFGFIFTGGTDRGKALTVSKVSLGSGADVCELKVKDEIVSINRVDISDRTSIEVGDMVAKAVGKGFIELKVRRERSPDDFSDEGMTSSSDEGEEDLSQRDYEPISKPSENLKRVEPQEQTKEVTEEIAAVRIDREQSIPVDFLPPPPPELSEPFNHTTETKDDVDEEDGGPPAILRKWQRQRQRNEYAFENSPSSLDSDSPVYKKISLNAPIPKRDNENEIECDKIEPQWRASRPWDERQDEWIKKQDEERLPDSIKTHNDPPKEQAKFDARQVEMKRQFEDSLKAAEQRVEEKSKQEQEFLQPELEKARILEERRMERRNRIQESAAAAAASSQIPEPTSSPQSSSFQNEEIISSSSASSQQATPFSSSNYSQQDSTAQNSNHVSSVTFNIEAKENAAPTTFNIPKQTGNGVILIDPRNQSGPVQGTPVQFQVKLAPKADDWRISQEEKERQRAKELEDEKMKIIKDKERQLQEQEELLRQEREKFRREQEEFRERQLQLQHHHQQQQQPSQQHLQQPNQSYNPQPTPGLYHPQQFQQPSPVQEQEYSYTNQHQNYSSPHSVSPLTMKSSSPSPHVNSVSPVQFSSPSSTSSSSPHYNNAVKSQPAVLSKSTWPPQTTQSSREPSRSYNNPPFTKSVNSTSYASVQPQFNVNVSSSNRVQNSPSPNNYRRSDKDRIDAPKSGKFSPEEMLAMNKKPFQESIVASRVNQVENQASFVKPSQTRIPDAQKRMPSSYDKEQIINTNMDRSLTSNSSPKTKLRNDNDWKEVPRNQSQTSPVKRDGNAPPSRRPAYSSPQEHWLVQEAERRRVSNQNPSGRAPLSQSGPIKPLPDINNRWRENRDTNNPKNSEFMPHAIRQTLLQKTAVARSSDEMGYDNNNSELIPPPNQQYLSQQPPQYQGNRSVSPRGGSGYSQQYRPDQRAVMPQQQSYSSSDLSNKYNVNPIQQIQKTAPPTINRSSSPLPPHHSSQGYHTGPRGRENGLPVNGSQLCSHCDVELGYGAAMVIESLGIFFHLNCFRCCVCHASLGTGAQGADVRVRMNKLHCQNCYSNDEGNKQRIYTGRKIWIEV